MNCYCEHCKEVDSNARFDQYKQNAKDILHHVPILGLEAMIAEAQRLIEHFEDKLRRDHKSWEKHNQLKIKAWKQRKSALSRCLQAFQNVEKHFGTEGH